MELSAHQLAHAQRANPRYQHRLGWELGTFAAAGMDPASEAFAQHIARLQSERGLTVDGIAGPRTLAQAPGRDSELGDELLGPDGAFPSADAPPAIADANPGAGVKVDEEAPTASSAAATCPMVRRFSNRLVVTM